MVFEGWIARTLSIWLALALVGGILDGVILRTGDVQSVNQVSIGGVASQPDTNTPGLASWVTTTINTFVSILKMLTFQSSLFGGQIGGIVRLFFLTIIAGTAIMGLASRVRG
jgi:hypothetical protein